MSDRNLRIIEMARDGVKYSEIGRIVGLTSGRVQQIAMPVVGRRNPKIEPINEVEIDRIRDLASNGLCMKAIAQAIGRDYQAVTRAAQRSSIEVCNGQDLYGDDLRRRAVYMVKSGLSCQEAADELGMTKNAVVGAVHRAGITIGYRPEVLSRPTKSGADGRWKRYRELMRELEDA